MFFLVGSQQAKNELKIDPRFVSSCIFVTIFVFFVLLPPFCDSVPFDGLIC